MHGGPTPCGSRRGQEPPGGRRHLGEGAEFAHAIERELSAAETVVVPSSSASIGQALGARYVIEGSVRKMGKRARVAAQFVSADSGARIWANKFDLVLEELYDDPDELVTQISGNVFAQLLTAESERAKRLPPDAMGIWEHCQLAGSYFRRWEVSIETIGRTLDALERAIATTPEFGLGHAILSWGCNAALVNGAYENDRFEPLIEKAKKHLELARVQAGDELCRADDARRRFIPTKAIQMARLFADR